MFSSRLYLGHVYHRRVRPRVHQLKYRVFSLLIDLEELPELHNKLRGFSWNRFNMLSVYDSDFGVHRTMGLRAGVDQALTDADILERPSRVLLSCFPRVFGYAFNPISLYYCLRSDGDVFAVIHEVHNTFGERHVYVLKVEPTRKRRVENVNKSMIWIQQHSSKELFVSPFAHMDMHYHFRLNVPNERQVLAIRLHDEEGLVLTASYTANQLPLTAKHIMLQVLRMPFMALKIMIGIHWEALLLWLKRVPWFSHVPKTTERRPPLTKS